MTATSLLALPHVTVDRLCGCRRPSSCRSRSSPSWSPRRSPRPIHRLRPGPRTPRPQRRALVRHDHLGRDLHAQIVYGTAFSMTSALIAVGIGVLAGGLIGLLAGFVDTVLSRLVDVLQTIPRFLLAIIVIALGFDTTNTAIAAGISAIGVFARLMRAEIIKTRQAAFVEAAFLQGGSRWHVLWRHVLPNASRSVLALAVLQVGLSILMIAGLAFLGHGDPPQAIRHDVPVCHPRYRQRAGDRAVPAAPSHELDPHLPGHGRGQRARQPPRALGDGTTMPPIPLRKSASGWDAGHAGRWITRRLVPRGSTRSNGCSPC